MEQTCKSLAKEQARYKRKFYAMHLKSKYEIPVGSYIYLRKEQGKSEEPKQYLAQFTTVPHPVVDVKDETGGIDREDEHERV